jgi:hypothetical protein
VTSVNVPKAGPTCHILSKLESFWKLKKISEKWQISWDTAELSRANQNMRLPTMSIGVPWASGCKMLHRPWLESPQGCWGLDTLAVVQSPWDSTYLPKEEDYCKKPRLLAVLRIKKKNPQYFV